MWNDNFPIAGSQSGNDLYGSTALGGGGQTAAASAAVTASAGGPAAAGNGAAWSWIGFVLLLVGLRVLIELGGEVD